MTKKIQKKTSSNLGALLYYAVVWMVYIKLGMLGYDAIFSTQEIRLEGFTVTAYCPCEKCNGKWKNLSIEGFKLKEDFLDKNIDICAVDPKIIPLGSYINYNNRKYWAKDIGYLIRGKSIDILLPTHELTIKFGRKIDQVIYKKEK